MKETFAIIIQFRERVRPRDRETKVKTNDFGTQLIKDDKGSECDFLEKLPWRA